MYNTVLGLASNLYCWACVLSSPNKRVLYCIVLYFKQNYSRCIEKLSRHL